MGIVGFFARTPAGPRMVIGPINARSLMTVTDVLYHEYVHYLQREHSEIVYPRWYSEGFAEVLSAARVEGGKVLVGGIPADRREGLRVLRDMTVRDLLQPNYESSAPTYWARFYANAWIYTHFLQMGSLGEDDELRRQTSDYLRRVHVGEDVIEAFSASYGIEPEDMDAELRRYRRSRKISSIELEVGEYTGTIERRELDGNEQAFLLADMAWWRDNEKAALKYLDDVSPGLPNAARPLSLSAVLRNHAEDFERADADAIAAFSLAPDDSQVLSNLAHLAWDRYESGREDGSADESLLQRTIDLGKRSVEIDPLNLEGYEFLWQGYAEIGEITDAARAMMAAYQILPSDTDINLTIGRFLFEQDRHDLAMPFLQRVLAWSHSAEQLEEVNEILGKIGARTGN